MKKWFLLIFIGFILSCKKDKSTTTNSQNWQINWVNVGNQNFYDNEKRILQLRGINIRVRGLFDVDFNDGRTPNEIVPIATKADIDSIASLGFNFIRLPINWSGYEPERDSINANYIPQIKQVVQWCKEANIYVQLDWHSDAFSKELGEDGAPYWTHKNLMPNPKWQGPLNFIILGLRRANPWVFESYRNLIRNNDGIRTEFMQIWTDLITAFKDEPTIIGFEPLNEPTTYFGGISDDEFIGFYKECSQKMRAIDTKHLLWLEPDGARNIFDQSPLLKQVFDTKVVYCPHYYPNLLGGANYSTIQGWLNGTNKSFDRIAVEGKSWNAPVCINEWGINPSTTNGKALVTAYQQQMEDRHLHGAYWLWKEPLPGTSGTDGTWGFFDNQNGTQNFQFRTNAAQNFVVPYCLALPGNYTTHHFDASTKILKCVFNNYNNNANPIVFIPAHTYANGFTIYINNEPVNYEVDNYNRYMVKWQSKNGEITLEVKPN